MGKGRTLGVAIATHLLVDLAYALDDVDSRDMHREDYMLFGEVSLWVFPNLVSDIARVYDTDMSGLLRGFFLEEWVDALTSEGTATNFIYQTVRVNAWRNSRNLSFFPRWMVDADITTGWGMAEVALSGCSRRAVAIFLRLPPSTPSSFSASQLAVFGLFVQFYFRRTCCVLLLLLLLLLLRWLC